MPLEFHIPVGEWPVHTILRARGPSDKRKYLVDWKVNPLTGALYEPSWVSEKNTQSWTHEANTMIDQKAGP
jgi:hypothetical protein